MNDFEKFACTEISNALARIDAAAVPDIYALSFFVDDVDGDPRYPWLQLGYNTRAQVAASTPSAASDAAEAKWNFAFWLQNELAFIGEPGTEGRQLLEQALKAEGLWYSDEEEESDFERCMVVADRITAYFVAACVRIAQALHASGAIEKRFGHPVPIIVHELEYYDQIAMQTAAANPPGLAQEFVDWVVKG